MRGAWTLFRREMKGYLQSPIATIVVIAFLLLSGGLFMSQFFLLKLLDMRAYFDLLPLLLAVVLPAVSMRLWAEDRQLNTLEMLLSLPLKPTALVAGKFLAAFVFFGLSLASTWTIPLMLRLLGRPDVGPIASGYLGAFLLGGLFLAVGQFISGLCRDQIVAFVTALFACLGLFLIGTEFIASILDGWWPGLGGFLQQYLGVTRHFASFQKGVVDLRDLVYFLLLTIVFLGLNGIWMEGRLRPRARVAFATACGLSLGIAMVAQGILEHLPLGRFDWTENRAYTVAPVSRELLRELEVPVLVKLYLSPPEKMPTAMRTLERDLKDVLEELRLVAGGKLRYEVFHMEASAALAEPTSGKEDSPETKLGRKGVRPFQVQSIEADELGVRLIYAGAAIAYKDRPEEVIPQLVPSMLDQFEYLILSKIYRMTLEKTPQIAVVAPYEQSQVDPSLINILAQAGIRVPGASLQDEYQYLPAVLEHDGYLIRRIRLTQAEPIPADTQALVMVEPGQMNERQCYEVNRFLVEGGALFLAAQRYRFDYVQHGRGIVPVPQKQPIGVDPLLETWGVEISPDILMDEESRMLSVSGGAMLGPFQVSVPVKSPIQISVGQSQMNQGLNMTSQLSPLFYLWGSPLALREDRLKANGLKSVTLFSSSPKSWTVSSSEFSHLSQRIVDRKKIAGRFPLAAWVTGAFPDHYNSQPIPDWPKTEADQKPDASAQEKTTPEPAKEAPRPVSQLSSKPGQLIMVGCDEMFKKQLAGSEGHLNFFLNAIDTLVSGGRLVGIRNKQQATRAFPTPSPATKAWLRFLTLGAMPMMVVGLSLAHAAWRRRLREAYAGL